jgi:hypothetical protein
VATLVETESSDAARHRGVATLQEVGK